jgi:hypothetical protein
MKDNPFRLDIPIFTGGRAILAPPPTHEAFAAICLLSDLLRKALQSGRVFEVQATEEEFLVTVKPLGEGKGPQYRPVSMETPIDAVKQK